MLLIFSIVLLMIFLCILPLILCFLWCILKGIFYNFTLKHCHEKNRSNER